MLKSVFVLVAIPVLLLFTVVGAIAAAPTVSTQTTANLGTFLTDPTGRTLYTFTGDTAGVSNVSGTLAAVWPPFRATGTLSLPAGVSGTLTLITRSDGTTQVAYNGQPLYTFAGDTGPNVVNGQGGDGGRFFVALAVISSTTPTRTVVAGTTAVATAVASPTVVASATAMPSVTVAASSTVVPSATVVATSTAAASTTAVAGATATPGALPVTGSPSGLLLPTAVAAVVAVGLGAMLRRTRRD